MSSKRIADLPVKNPTDAMKLPTGGFGDYAVTLKTLASWLINSKDFAEASKIESVLDQKANIVDVYAKQTVDTLLQEVSNEVSKKVSKDYVDGLVITANEGITNFKTQTELLSFVPKTSPFTAKALDTKLVWWWDGKSWINTGLSELDLAKQYALSNPLFSPVIAESNQDLNLYSKSGYYAFSSSSASTVLNSPVNSGFSLEVLPTNTAVIQKIITRDNRIFIRTILSGVDTEWVEILTEKNLRNSVDAVVNENNFYKPKNLNIGTDLNQLSVIGIYASSASVSQNLINSPTKEGFSLEVLPTNTAVIQKIITRSGEVFVRTLSDNDSTWTNLKENTVNLSVSKSSEINKKTITQTLESSANTQTKYAYAIADESNNIGFALGINGDIEGAGVTQEPTLIKSEVVWGISDDANNVPLAQLSNGNTIIAGLEHSQSKVNALVDSNGNATLIVDESGALHQAEIVSKEIKSESFIQVHISCYEEDGDIYVVNAGETKKITNDGLNKNPVFVNDRVVFISSKQRGLDKQYQYKDGVISRYYPTKDFAKYQIALITGQSLSIGPQRLDPISMPLVGAYKLNGHSIVATPNNPSNGSIVPLSEGYYHTIATGFAQNLVDQSITVLGTARTGTAYADLKKGAQYGVFEEGIAQVERVNSEDKYSFMPALIVIHGEEDGKQSVPLQTYVGFLREWLDDYNADIRKVKGSSSAVMLTCQTGSIAGYRNIGDRETFQTPLAQLEANNTQPDIFLVCPKYAYTYKDHAHPDAISTTHLGEMYAKVYRKVVLKGEDWNPLKPTKFTATGSKIIVDFHVPKAPLQFDTEIISSVANQGFELTKSGGVTITDVQITSPTQVTITCSANVPTGCVLSYAWYNGTYQKSGRAEGSRGALKDSDNTPDLNGFMPLNNWCVHFKQTLNF